MFGELAHAALERYDMQNRQDFTDAMRGIIAPWPSPVTSKLDAHVVFDPAWLDFISDDASAPNTVNPSLWRQSQLQLHGGLVKIAEGVYQARNNDIANLTVIEGPSGLVDHYAVGSWFDIDPRGAVGENANHSLHNIQTLRGARTRGARNYARYLDETLERRGDQAEAHYGPHTWPVWGNGEIVSFLESQRDTYKYIHVQALRMANQGFTPLEAAEATQLPQELGRAWFNHVYHDTVHHNIRAAAKHLQADAHEQMGHQASCSTSPRYGELLDAFDPNFPVVTPLTLTGP